MFKNQRTTGLEIQVARDGVGSFQLQSCTRIENQVIPAVTQRGILHPHGGFRALVSSNTITLVDSAILYSQASAVEIGHGIHLRGAGETDFLRRAGYIVLGLVQVILRSGTGKDNITLLLNDVALCSLVVRIQIHRSITAHID